MPENMIQIGVAALRSPKGDFLPAVPLFIKAEDARRLTPQQEERCKRT